MHVYVLFDSYLDMDTRGMAELSKTLWTIKFLIANGQAIANIVKPKPKFIIHSLALYGHYLMVNLQSNIKSFGN